jgi:NADH dehydrogenase
MLKKHLVIVGGGWAGIKLARELRNLPTHKLRITLITDNPNFRYTPALYRAATGYKERTAIIPIGEVLSDIGNVTVVISKAKSIDRKKRIITTESGKTFHYDYAAFALGMVTTYFGIQGLEERAFSIKTTHELRKLRTHLLEEALHHGEPDANYVVVGGGATGVELAAGLKTYLRSIHKRHGRSRKINISLVEAAPRILPLAPPAISKQVTRRLRSLGIKVMTKQKVEGEDARSLIVSGVKIPTACVIWTAGVTNNPFYKQNESQFRFSERGKIEVDNHLQVDHHVYVMGDNAATQYSGLALTAVNDAKFVAKDIKRRLRGSKLTPAYRQMTPSTVVPVGKGWAIFQYKNIRIGGRIGGLIRMAADFIGYADILGFRQALGIWSKSEQLETVELSKQST